MMSRIVKSILLLFIVCVSFSAVTAYGQFADSPDEVPVMLEVSPKNPGPGQAVGLKVTSYLSNLDSALITWHVNDKRISSGRGMREFSTTVGNVGALTTIKATITTQEGRVITKSISLRPATVALVWEAASYTPPFYQGKARVGPGSLVRIIALPQFQAAALAGNNYIFTWTKDGRVLGSQSGYGKNVLELAAPLIGNTLNIGVTVTSADGTAKATNVLRVASTQPKLVVYPHSPIYGTQYNKAIGDELTMTSKEMSFSAIPYFIALPEFSTELVRYTWTMNGGRVNTDNNSVMTFRNDANTTGTTIITVSAKTNGFDQTNKKEFAVGF